MRGLKLFTRTSDRRCFNLASWHSPHSLTWSWILSLSFPRADGGRWLHFSTYRSNVGLQWCLQVARIGLRWHRQRPMWFSDLYQRKRDEVEAEAMQQTFDRETAMPPPPTIINGSQSVH